VIVGEDDTSKDSLENGVSLATVHVSVRLGVQSPPGSVNSVEFTKFLLSTSTLMFGWKSLSPRMVNLAARQTAAVLFTSTDIRQTTDLPDMHGQKSSV
jgi:hypothetical protein